MPDFKVGDKVKWAEVRYPEEGEAEQRFIVLEINGDRCILQWVCNMAIPGTRVAMCNELVLAND